MCSEQESKNPSEELAERAVSALLADGLLCEQYEQAVTKSLAQGTASVDGWLLWVDLAMDDNEGGSDE